MIPSDEWGQLREDVGWIRSTLEHDVATRIDHEERLRSVEKKVWAAPGSVIAAVLTLVGIHFNK